MKSLVLGLFALGLWAGTSTAGNFPGHLETENLPKYLRDRGEGIPLSQFGTYVNDGQWFVYPFFEYYHDDNAEYAPSDLGFGLDEDFRGKYRAYEGLIFIGYGLTDRLAFELEAAIIKAKLEKSSADPTALPAELEESGLGDVEGQIRYRWTKETQSHPEVFSYFETVIPTQDEGSLIGTTDWEFKLGAGVTRGFGFGTMTVRAAIEYDKAEDVVELGEMALEYLRRLNSHWRVYVGVEGTQDEVEFIPEAQWHFSRRAFLKMNSAFGLTSKATDWAPEVGVLISF